MPISLRSLLVSINIRLLSTMGFQPKVKQIVSNFLEQMSNLVNAHFHGRPLPVRIQLLGDQSELFPEFPGNLLRSVE